MRSASVIGKEIATAICDAGWSYATPQTLAPIIAHRLHEIDEQPANIRAYFVKLIQKGFLKEPFASKMLKEVLSIL